MLPREKAGSLGERRDVWGAEMCGEQIREECQLSPAPKGLPVKASTLQWAVCTTEAPRRGRRRTVVLRNLF